MDRKEYATAHYDCGWRAYQTVHGKPFFQGPDGLSHNVYGTMDRWNDLRAYQDEQRKKGEPIEYDFPKINGIWYGLNHIADGIKYHYCGSSMGGNKITPEIALLPGAKMGDFPIVGTEYGGFKNFRWRPGKGPKGGDHGHN